MPLEPKDLISATLSSTALLVSVVTFALNYRHTRKSAVLTRKPVLVFEYDGEQGWLLRNVGAGPALNVIVAQKRVGGEWFNPVRVPPLSKDGKFLLGWLGHVNTTGLGATYVDTFVLNQALLCVMLQNHLICRAITGERTLLLSKAARSNFPILSISLLILTAAPTEYMLVWLSLCF